MIENHRKCEGKDCKKITFDHMADGWITVGDGGFQKYKGRDKNRTAVTQVYVSKGADFCSWKCLRSNTGYKNATTRN